MTQPSATYLLIEARLGEPLAGYVQARRPARSWRRLAMDIYATTGVDVAYETLRNWFSEPERAA